jgi:hypothetical protein
MKDKLTIFLKKITDKFRSDPFWGDKLIRVFLSINLALNAILWGIIIFKSRSVAIPFYNPVALSARFLTQKGQEIYILPIIGIFILLVDLFLAERVFKQEKFLAYLFLGVSLFIQIMLLVTLMVYLLI